MDLFPKDGESCVKAGLPLVTATYGFKKNVFASQKSANDRTLANTGIVNNSMGFSLNCPISVLPASTTADTDAVTSEYQHALELESSKQLSLPFNVHRIDQRLSLAPNGHWSKMDYHLNKDGLINEFLKDFVRFNKNKIRNKKRYFETFDMVLANLLLANYESSQLLLSRQNGQHKNNNPLRIDNRTIALITVYLADRGLIDLYIGRRSKEDKNSSWCIPLLPLIAILDRYDARIRLHEKTQLAVVRDGDKNAMKMYTDRNKRLALIRYGKPVAQHYKTWLNHTAMLDARYLLPWLKRLFNWNMDLGGRFYGHYQNIPKVDRRRILIDGERTVELDYKSVHITLLYALEGLPVPAEPYDIEGDGNEEKIKTYKAICLTLVNTERLSSLQANLTRSGNPKVQQESKSYKAKRERYGYLKSLALKATEPTKPMSIRKGFIENIPTNANGSELLELIMDRHQPIAHHFGVQNIGLKLQKLDSELMANALTKLDGMPCLPVHDSIRCRLSDMRMVTDAMIEAFRELHGQKIVVTNDLSKHN